jgi:hypothetical protein
MAPETGAGNPLLVQALLMSPQALIRAVQAQLKLRRRLLRLRTVTGIGEKFLMSDCQSICL